MILRFCLFEKGTIVTEMYTPTGQSLALLAPALVLACVPPPRMCTADSDCGAQASCVAGRCVAHGATPAIDRARRLLFLPTDVAYLRHDSDKQDVVSATLGWSHAPGAVVLLRFSARLPEEANILEAYVVLERATDWDADPMPISLHAARIVEAWDSRWVSWARQPRIEEAGAPVTRVWPAAGRLVRLDVRALVQRWRRRSGDDFGIAIRGEETSGTGIVFALAPGVAPAYDAILAPATQLPTQSASPFEPHPVPAAAIAQPRAELTGPRLEVYVK